MCKQPHSVEVIHPTVIMQLTLTRSYKAYFPVLAVALLRLTVLPHGKLLPMQKTRLRMPLSRIAIIIPKIGHGHKAAIPTLRQG